MANSSEVQSAGYGADLVSGVVGSVIPGTGGTLDEILKGPFFGAIGLTVREASSSSVLEHEDAVQAVIRPAVGRFWRRSVGVAIRLAAQSGAALLAAREVCRPGNAVRAARRRGATMLDRTGDESASPARIGRIGVTH